MEETPHLVAHFMAVGAEKRLEDYHFLRNTYETISGQETQLNRILRMLGEDEINLNWRVDLLPIGRSRARSLYEFDRTTNTIVLQGSMAYERLRELEQDNSKNIRQATVPTTSRRVQELRERRQRLSEQRDYPPSLTSDGSGGGGGGGGRVRGGSVAPSSSRLQALAEYDAALVESESKRKRQAEENRLNSLKNDEKELTERRQEKFRTTFNDDENQKYREKSKQQEDESNKYSTKTTRLNENQENDFDKTRKSSIKYGPDKSGDIELISFTVRCQPVPSTDNDQDKNNPTVRLLCKWASPSSSSAIDYFTIERKLDHQDWLPIGEKINKLDNQTQLDISAENDDEINKNLPSYFRLKAHLQNGQTFTSKSTDGIFINLIQEKNIIKPDIQILSPSSVQLTWHDQENEEKIANIYDIEKKEEQQPEWEKVIEVPLSQRSARIDSLTDAEQCQFRLIPTFSEPAEIENEGAENQTKPEQITEIGTENQVKRKETTKIGAEDQVEPEEITKTDTENQSKTKETTKRGVEDQFEPEETTKTGAENQSKTKEATRRGAENQVESEETEKTDTENQPKPKEITRKGAESQVEAEETTKTGTDNQAKPKEIAKKGTENQAESDETTKTDTDNQAKPKETARRGTENQAESEETTKTDTEDQVEPEVLTVDNVDEWLSSLHIVPTSPNTVDVDISEEGFKEFDCYKIEYTTNDKLNQWKQVSNITYDDPHLTIDSLKQGTDYKFRFTPILPETNETNSSQLSLVLDVKMPSRRKERFTKSEDETPTVTSPQFSIQKLDATSVLIEAVVPNEEPAVFEDIYDVYSKNETTDDDWNKVGTIDKENLSTTVENLEENTSYAFKIDNITSPLADDENNTIQEFKFDTTPVKKFDPSLFLEKIEQSLENVVNGVMQAAAGHQTLDEPVNKSLNEVIKEVFRDETLVPNEKYGFDTLSLNNDLQIYRGPKQMMINELEVDETIDLSEHYGEIIIHNYRTSQQSVIVREENGNTRVANIDGDIIIRNVMSDVSLKNEKTNHQLSMNIVGQAFLKGVQGSLLASKFKGIIVVKHVHKP